MAERTRRTPETFGLPPRWPILLWEWLTEYGIPAGEAAADAVEAWRAKGGVTVPEGETRG